MYFQTFLAWPREEDAAISEILANFGYTMTRMVTAAELRSDNQYSPNDHDWFPLLWRGDVWQVILFNYSLSISGDDAFHFPVIAWQWDNQNQYSSYQIDIVLPNVADVGIEVKEGALQQIFGVHGLSAQQEHYAKLSRKHRNNFLGRFYELAYVNSLKAMRLPKEFFFREDTRDTVKPIPHSFSIFSNGVETLKSLNVPFDFLPYPHGQPYYLMIE